MTVDDALVQKEVDCDWFLQTLIHSANMGVELGVTLTTGSGIVTGTIIGGAKYMDMQKAALSPHWGSDSLRESFDGIFDQWRERYVPSQEEESDPSPPIFIHLSNARILVGNQFVPTGDGVLWRGKLDSIIGFAVGVMSSNN